MDEKLKEKIGELVGDAYDIGHCHGMNAYRISIGEKTKKDNQGWGKYYEKLIKLLEKEELKKRGK